MSSIQIKTEIHGAMIVQETTGPGIEIDNVREIYARRVIDTQELQVRDALIRMGWTPPRDGPDSKPIRMCIIQQSEHEHSTTSYATIRDFQQARESLILATKAVDPA